MVGGAANSPIWRNSNNGGLAAAANLPMSTNKQSEQRKLNKQGLHNLWVVKLFFSIRNIHI